MPSSEPGPDAQPDAAPDAAPLGNSEPRQTWVPRSYADKSAAALLNSARKKHKMNHDLKTYRYAFGSICAVSGVHGRPGAVHRAVSEAWE